MAKIVANSYCEHPNGCLNVKFRREYTRKDGSIYSRVEPYCRPHYNRLNRGAKELGPSEIRNKNANGSGWQSERGYIELYIPSHPLAMKNGKVLLHRKVLYDKMGPGDHTCHWCKSTLTWKQICADHVDFDKLNNHPDNLVVSCQGCNTRRFNALVRYIVKNSLVPQEILEWVK